MKALALLMSLVVLGACSSEPEDTAKPSAASGSATPAAAPEQHLRNYSIADPRTFNPIITTDQPSSEATSLLFDSLVRMNPRTTEIEPYLAESWEVNGEGTEYVFHLREDVVWHDGERFDAEDVVFTFAAIHDDRVPNSLKHILRVDGQAVRAEAVDDFTVRIRLPRPFAPLLSTIEVPVVPEHVLGDALEQGTFTQMWGVDTAPQDLIGTGPYRMVRYEPAQFIRYERNPRWWMRDEKGRRLPRLAEQTILIVPDQDAAYLKFLSGETDVHRPRPEEVAELERRADELEIRVEEQGLDTGTQFLTFNRNPRHYVEEGKRDPRLSWFQDRSFLRALAHAVDRESMVISCLHGLGRPATAHISPENHRFHEPDLEPYAYDLEEAKRLLEEGGYADRDGDGIREDAGGNRLSLRLNTNAGNQIREKMCSILQEDWKKLGIDVHYRPVDFTLLVEKLDNTYDWDVILIGFTGGPEPHNGANLLRSSGNLHLWNPSQPEPATEWEAEIDRLMEEGSRELDSEKRREIYRTIQRILHEELPMIQTIRPLRHVAFNARLSNFEMTPWGLYRPELIHFTR